MTESESNRVLQTDESNIVSDLEKKIIRQVEYYFSDVNLMRDKFMLEKIKLDEGWIPLETMIKFNRLKQLSTDFSVICTALSKSKSGLLQISEDNSKLRRHPEKNIPSRNKENMDNLKSRTVHVDGYSLDSSLEDLMEHISAYCECESIRFERNDSKKFNGSAFLVLKDLKDVRSLLENNDFKQGETFLEVSTLDDYNSKKIAKQKLKKEEENRQKDANLQRREQRKIEELKKEAEEKLTKGEILHLSGLSANTTRHQIKEALKSFGNVAWVDVENNGSDARVRFGEENSAQPSFDKALSAGDGKLIINNAQVEGRVLEGDEEIEHWYKMFQEKHNNKKHHVSNKRGNKNKFKGPPRKKRRSNEESNQVSADVDD